VSLRKAYAIAEKDGGGLAARKKLWAVYALAMQGEAEAVDLLDAGRHKTSRIEIFESMSGLEVVAMLTQPASIPRLLARLEIPADPKETMPDTIYVLRALKRIADPATYSKIEPFLEHPNPRVRAEAARAVGALGLASATDRLMASLGDENDDARQAVALALEDQKPSGKRKEILAHLEVENDVFARAALYRLLGATEGEAVLDVLRGFLDRPDPLDRMWAADVIGKIDSKKGLNALRYALKDEGPSVALRAISAIEMIGGPGAEDTLLALLQDPRDDIVEATAQTLARMGEKRAGPRIAELILTKYLAEPLVNPSRFAFLYVLGDTLVELNFTEPLPRLREKVKLQPDGTVVSYVEGLIRRLSLLATNGEDRMKWVAMLGDNDTTTRRIAIRRVGEIGGSESVKALGEAFGRVDRDDQVEILRALARSASPEAAPLVERVLLDDAFDAPDGKAVREMSAWAARRIGGAKMTDALRRSAERRSGQEMNVLVYYAILAGKDSTPVLRSLRAPRLRYYERTRGLEQERLDWMIRELSAGRPIRSLDVPPEDLELH
jgi:HEAT repeat protein